MLTESEWAEVHPFISKSVRDFKSHREATGASLDVATKQGFGQVALDKYHEITGFRETNVNALWHHRLGELGPPCESCRKPMRTKQARFCAECGHVPSDNSSERNRDR